ncbi:MAG: leucyl aminopeptidase family protein [Alphaproteobacteria bacterium]|nr:leucyl aminopeptidase family protein [Alphaproteobacteria bacterium]
MPLTYISQKTKGAVPVTLLTKNQFKRWVSSQSKAVKASLETAEFTAAPGTFFLLLNGKGRLQQVIAGISGNEPIWDYAFLPSALPKGRYYLDKKLSTKAATEAALGWVLGTYKFTRYKPSKASYATLCLPPNCDAKKVGQSARSIYLVRDLINTPAEDMGPDDLYEATMKVAESFGASCSAIIGEDLLEENYPAVYAVGKGSDNLSHLIDLTWGQENHPKVTLVGKGVCFDSGGLDIKSAGNMRLMKKDMGGAAHTLGLARMIMAANLPVRLRLIIPAVENSVSGRAMRPLDVVPTRSGKTIEIGHTDAEGRVILADGLAEAVSEKPDLLIDMATLTGAARAALGTDLPALFSNKDDLAAEVVEASKTAGDPLWHMPLWHPYRGMMNSSVADISNDSNSPYGGAIAAALFLHEFAGDKIPWIHMDLMAWNTSSRPGRPEGGEAMGMRALYTLIAKRWPAKGSR